MKGYKKYKIAYQQTTESVAQTNLAQSRKTIPNHKKRTLFQRIKDYFTQLSYEKMTVMIIPHNEARMVHFHISTTSLLFLIFLFITTIFTSVVSFVLHKSEYTRADNLHKEAREIRRKLYIFTEQTRRLDRHISLIRNTTISMNQSINNDAPAHDLFNKSKHDMLYLDQTEEPQNSDLLLLYDIQKDFLQFGLQAMANKEFLKTRQKVIYETPSVWPAYGRITSLFGYRRDPFTYAIRFHAAVDIAAAYGTPIYSTAPGYVRTVSYNSGYGNHIEITHGYGYSTLYAHNSANLVSVGQKIRKGQLIARMGSTGRSTGSHIHYEVHTGGYAINPAPYLDRW